MAKKLAASRVPAGQSLTEFAIALPVLIIILMGALDLGRLYHSYVTIFNAAREGARYGASNPSNTSGIITRVQNEATGSGITIINGTNATISPSCSPCTPGNPLNVTVQYTGFQLITAFILGGGTIPMQVSVQMEIFAK